MTKSHIFARLLTTMVITLLFQPTSSDASGQLDKIASDYYEWRLAMEPEWATRVGVYKYNDQLESWNYTDFESRKDRAQVFLDQVMSIKRSDLDKTHMVTYNILKDVLTTYIDGYRWWKFQPLNPLTFLEGFLANPPDLIGATPLDTFDDYLNFIVRAEKMPQQYDEMMEAARLAMQYNHTLNNVSVNRIPGMIDDLTANESSFPLIEPFLTSKAANILNTSLKNMTDRMKTANKNLITKLKEVKSFIQNEYMPSARKSWGIQGWENGIQNYIDTLRWHTSLNISPAEIHQKGLEEVDRIQQEMLKVISRLQFNGSVQEFYRALNKNSSFLIMDQEATLKRFQDIITVRIMPKLADYFEKFPNLPVVVKNTGSDGIGGEYMAGSADGSRPGTFYVNIRRPEDNPTYSMPALMLHETVPGHHLAESYGLVSDLPAFRKHMNWRAISAPFFFPFFNSYVEGWGLYSEYLGEEMGIYKDDFELMGRYSEEMFRACRLVIDTGLHYFGWNRDKAIEYFRNYTSYTEDVIETEIDRYITWPGQACGYKLGEIKMKELRQKATKELGPLFDLPGFHYVILSNGPMSLSLLEDVIDDWIKDVKSKNDNPTSNLSRIRIPANVIYCVAFLHFLF